MASQATINGFTSWTIDAGDGLTAAVFVPELGAIGSSLTLPGPGGARETLFRQDFFWDPATEKTRGGLPFLFPVCGRLERGGHMEHYLYDGRLHQLQIHGFAHRMPWRVTAHDKPSELVMELNDTPETRERYPFAFTVRLTYRVAPGVLFCEQRYLNRGDRPMPYYAGFHPYFLTPPPRQGKDAVRLDLTPDRFLAYNARLTDIVGDKPRMAVFPVSITDPAIHEQLVRVAPASHAQLLFPDGFGLRLDAGGDRDPAMFPYMQLYTMPDQPFFCVEPWMGVPNALNSVTGVRWLAPGQSETGRICIGTKNDGNAQSGNG